MTKRAHVNPACRCWCPECRAEAQSIPGTKHRRCKGKKRGTWERGRAPVEELAEAAS